MLSHCLIFLCIGVYASCMPTFPPILKETIHFVEKIMKEGTVKFKNESMQSLEIPITLEKECVLYNFNKFIQSLDLLKIEDSEIHNSLKALAESEPIAKILTPQKDNKDCEISIISINKFLEELADFLRELSQLLKSH